MKNVNTKDFWDNKILTEKSTLLQSPIYRDKIKYVVQNIKSGLGNLLDIGFGYGILEEKLVKIGSKLKLHGIDISSTAVRGIDKIVGDFRIGTAINLPYKNKKFSYVILLDVIEHFSTKKIELIFNEVNRVLKKGGYLIISVPLNEKRHDSRANGHITNFTKKLIYNLIELNGYVVIKYKVLYAFNHRYVIKSILSKYLGINKPNLIILIAKKK